MNEAYSTALMLLLVGMITVFLILTSVVFIGKLIIYLVNKYFPEEVKDKIKESIATSIDAKKLTAIVSAVDVVTRGKGRIIKIEKATN